MALHYLLAAVPLCSGSDSWRTEIVLQHPFPLTACAVSDVDPFYPGEEIIVASQDGTLLMVASQPGGWQVWDIASPAGEVLQIVIGEMDERVPGEEIALVCAEKGRALPGRPSEVWCLRQTEGGIPPWESPLGWKPEWLYTSETLLSGINILGPSLTVAGQDRRVLSIDLLPGGQREVLPYAELPGAARMAAALPDASVFACADGTVVLVQGHPRVTLPFLGPDVGLEVLHHRDAERTALDAGPDGRFLVGDKDGTLTWIDPGQASEVLLHAGAPLRGVVLADLDPSSPGLEAAAAGDGRQVHLLTREGRDWKGSVVLVDTSPVLALASGDLEGDGDQDLVVLGASGRLFVIDSGPR